MKADCCIVIFFIAAFCAVLAAETDKSGWGPKSGNLQMSVQLKGGGNEIKTNQPIELTVLVRNLSTNGSAVFTEWMEAEIFAPGSSKPAFRVEGKDPEDTLLKDGSSSGNFHRRVVPRSGYYGYGFNLGRLRNAKTNSVYKIVTKRMVGTNLVVTSNPLFVKVVPGEWKAPPPLDFP